MKIFVTGATGFIGSAIRAGIDQSGTPGTRLTRSDAGARSLIAAGAEVHRGSLEDLEASGRERNCRTASSTVPSITTSRTL